MHGKLSTLSHVARKHINQSLTKKETIYFLHVQNFMVGITAVRCWTIIKRTMLNTELLDNFHKNNILFGVSSFFGTLEWFSLTVFLELSLNTSKMLFRMEILCNLTFAAMSFRKSSIHHKNQHCSLSVHADLWKLNYGTYSRK